MGEENLPELTIHVHGLKSSLASVGAVSLSQLALSLEKACTASDAKYCREKLPSFIRQLENLGRQLETVFANTANDAEDSDKPAGDADGLEEGMGCFMKALALYDYEAVTECMENLRVVNYGPDAKDLLEKIQNHIDQFDYDSAGKLVVSFMENKARAT